MCGSSEDLLELELSVDDSIECFLCDESFEDIVFSFSPTNKSQGDKGLNVLKCDCKLGMLSTPVFRTKYSRLTRNSVF